MTWRRSLNGEWLFNYSENVMERPVGFEALNFNCQNFNRIHVPGHIQLCIRDSHVGVVAGKNISSVI